LDNKTLGAGADQAFATDSATAADDTFNVSDKVDGGAGDDTFFLTLNDSAADVDYTPSRITNFETLSLTNIDDAESLTVDVSLMGVTAIENAASTQNVIVDSATAGTILTVTGATGTTTLNVKGTGLTGTADNASLALTGVSGAVTIASDSAQDFETATVAVEGTNTSDVTIQDSGANAAITSVTVTGTGSWDMEGAGSNLATALTTLDASANTGGVTFTASVAGTTLTGGAGNDGLTGAAGNDVISGGEGDDTLAMGAGGDDNVSGGAGNDTVTVTALTEDDTIDGGDGVDTLVIGAAIAYDDEAEPTPIDDGVNISGFEVLRSTATLTQDLAALDGIVALASASGVLTATEASDIGDFFALANNTGVDLTLATDGAADSLNIHMGLDLTQSNATGVTVDAIEIETALIASLGADGNTLTDFEADSLTSLTVIGSKTLSVTLNDSAAVATIPLTTVDASAFTGDSLTITAVEADSGVTVTTGSEALSVTVGDGANDITGTAGDDEITTGSGNDTIVSFGGDDEIVAGDGANTITVTDGENDIDGGEGVDTITAGNGNNTIDGGDGADVIVAGSGNNTITNAAGNATITAGSGDNTVTNTAGNSTITLGDGDNTVNLTAGNSTVVTGDGADDINITAGDNNITAGAGNDTISLGSGNDTVDAGAGTDTVDFSVSSGTWTGSVSNAENIAATFSGSARIDADGLSGYSSLTVAASDDTTTVTLRNLSSSTVALTDDNAEDGSNGDLEAVVIDMVDDAALTISLGGNQEAAIATASVLGSLTITDAESVTLKSTGGSFGNLITNDYEGVALDDDETTSLTVDASSNYSSIATANITGSEGLTTLALSASGIESDVEVDTLADATNLQTLSLTASGLNSQLELGAVGDAGGATSAILTSFSATATNGADIDFQGGADAETGDINTLEDLDSITLSASGTGSTITGGQIWADGLNAGAVSISASAGATIDMETDTEADDIINYAFDSLTISATGTNSVLNLSDLSQDAGSLAATAEANITISALDGAEVNFGTEANFGGVDVDLLTIRAGANADLDLGEATVTASGNIGSVDIDFDANSGIQDSIDITADYITGTLSLTVGDEAGWDEEGIVIALSNDVEATVGIKTLNLDIADQDGSAITVDLEDGEAVDIGGAEFVEIADSEADVATYYNGSITLAGDDNNTVLIGNNTLLDTALPTAGTASVYGSWTVTTGAGDDTITGSRGADNITSGDGADSVLGGAGNDTLTVGNGADTVGAGAGTDSIVLTESVSSADVVEFSSAVGTSSDSGVKAATSGFIDSGEDTITSFTAGVDTIKITSTAVADFVHVTDTDLGEGDASAEGDDSNSFATNVGLINMDGGTADEFGDDGDILINFASPTTTMTEALFEAALQYDLTGTAAADTITTGVLADTIDGGEGGDTINVGSDDEAADVVVYDVVGEGSAGGVAGTAYSGFDVITGFETTVDHIDYNATVDDTVVIAGTVGDSDLTSANYTDDEAVLAFFNDDEVEDAIAGAGDYEANEDFVVAVTIADVGTVIYEIVDATVGTLDTSEIALVATVDATMVAGDFL